MSMLTFDRCVVEEVRSILEQYHIKILDLFGETTYGEIEVRDGINDPHLWDHLAYMNGNVRYFFDIDGYDIYMILKIFKTGGEWGLKISISTHKLMTELSIYKKIEEVTIIDDVRIIMECCLENLRLYKNFYLFNSYDYMNTIRREVIIDKILKQ